MIRIKHSSMLILCVVLTLSLELATKGAHVLAQAPDQTADDSRWLLTEASEPIEKNERGDVLQSAPDLIQLEESKDRNIFDRRVIAELKAQYNQLQTALQYEDAYSLRLGELYSEYGALLFKAQRYDEAVEVYTQALHIQKVNYGIYSPEQLSLLKVLFDLALVMEEGDMLAGYTRRAISIEQKNNPSFSYDIVTQMSLRMGHYFIDQYYKAPRSYRTRLHHLETAKYYFDYVLVAQQGKTFEEQYSPYGELLLISHLENNLLSDLPAVYDRTFSGSSISTIGVTSTFQEAELERNYNYLRGSFARSVDYLNRYLVKARAEENDEEVVNALFARADNLVLFGRYQEAKKYYKLAWGHAQTVFTYEELRSKYINPERLPAYTYLHKRDDERAAEEVISIPLSFSVGTDGSVSNIQVIEGTEDLKKYFSKARRELREFNFRPAIVDGDAVAVQDFIYPVKVVVN